MRIAHGLFRSRVARRLFGAFVACALVPMALLAALSLGGFSRQLVLQTDRALARACRDASQDVVERLDDLERDARACAAEVAGLDPASPAAAAALGAFRGRVLVGVALAEGGGVLAASPGFRGPPPATTPGEAAHLAAGGAVLRLGEGADALLALALLVDPARPDGPLLVAEAPRDLLVREQVFAAADTELRVFYLGSRLLASSLGERTPHGELAGALGARGPTGRFELAVGEQRYAAAYRRAFLRPRFLVDVTAVCGLDRGEAFASLRYFQRVFVLVAALALCTVLWLTLLQIRRTLGPIATLRAAARRIAEGELAPPDPIRTGDELEELGRDFGTMAERVRERTEQLERANRAKDRFLAHTSHELRTPMTSILGYVDLCRAPGATAEERESHLAVVARSGSHMLALIDDVLDLSRIGAGRVAVARAPCSPAAVVRDAVDALRPAAEAAGLALALAGDAELPPLVATDSTRLRQVLSNLLANALRFTERGGVEVDARIAPAPGGGGDVLSVCVADSGPGLAEADVERVFEPFEQGDPSLTRRHGGLGLGLPIARAFARALGGDVVHAPRPGGGSRFTLTVAVGTAAERAALAAPGAGGADRSAAPEPRPIRGERVLLAEDVEVNRRLVTKLLEREGLRVDGAEDGLVALSRVRAARDEGDPYAIVLTDIQMPGLDGYQLAAALRADGFAGPIVALTAHSMEGERERCLAAGCDDFATKPVQIGRLREVLQRQLRRAA